MRGVNHRLPGRTRDPSCPPQAHCRFALRVPTSLVCPPVDAGGLRRQFFDMFTGELQTSGLWTRSAAGNLRPVDGPAAEGATGRASLRTHMETCGRVCGMALYQELHRRSGEAAMLEALQGRQPPNFFGDAFARHFVRLVQHDPPRSLAELQAELRAESLEEAPDYRASAQIVARSVEESGLDATFVRMVGEREVALVEGGAAIPVTDDNKCEWLERLLRAELVESCQEAATHFRKGFVDVVGLPSTYAFSDDARVSRWTTPHFFILTADELQVQWSGAPVSQAAIAELRSAAAVHPEVRVQAEWLWDLMDALDDDERSKYYRFMTGSSRCPSGGPPDFKIGPKAGGDGAYPFAHACVNSLDMPCYSSREVLHERLSAAVRLAHDKFTDL